MLLLFSQHVVTAAHCVDPYKPSHVVVGEHNQTNPNDGQEFMSVANVYLHPKWIEGDHDYDLAIIKLYKHTSNIGARAAFLPKPNENFSKYTVDGWGLKGKETSDVLRTVELDDIKPTDSLASNCLKLNVNFE